MYVFFWYFLNANIKLLLCFYGIYFAATYIFKRFIKSQRGFSNASAGYTFYPHSDSLSCPNGLYINGLLKYRKGPQTNAKHHKPFSLSPDTALGQKMTTWGRR